MNKIDWNSLPLEVWYDGGGYGEDEAEDAALDTEWIVGRIAKRSEFGKPVHYQSLCEKCTKGNAEFILMALRAYKGPRPSSPGVFTIVEKL